jgi:hypothetical protein
MEQAEQALVRECTRIPEVFLEWYEPILGEKRRISPIKVLVMELWCFDAFVVRT